MFSNITFFSSIYGKGANLTINEEVGAVSYCVDWSTGSASMYSDGYALKASKAF